jgi:hypothetical protein
MIRTAIVGNWYKISDKDLEYEPDYDVCILSNELEIVFESWGGMLADDANSWYVFTELTELEKALL